MSSSGITIRTTSGEDPKRIVARWKEAATPSVGDALYAGQRQRSRILDRTGRGLDVDGKQFKPYSEKGPYYYNPNGRLGALQKQIGDKSQKAAAKRFLGKITTAAERSKSGSPTTSRTGRTVRFESYAAFKKWLGRSVVDLRGPRSPNMLGGLTVKASGNSGDVRLAIGIYGDAAKRANGHNTGTGTVPQRRFFGVSKRDLSAMVADVRARIRARLKGTT
ncbi:MAG: hypothetical protein IT168_33260 [Bryobacterales bacterium]|nr:hypothetical protein [Bryobacterales bacterium]